MPLLAPTGSSSTLCHNDLAPYNIVARDGRLVGIIDWDVISPGTPLWEVAFMAWQWVPLHHPGLADQLGWHAPERLGPRLRLLCDAYRLVAHERARLVDTIIERIAGSRSGISDLAANGEPAFIRMLDEGHATDMSSTIEHIEAIRQTLGAALRQALQQALPRPSKRALAFATATGEWTQ